MRIISQDGSYDLPYDLCAIYLNKELMQGVTVRCRWQADQKASLVIAQYQSMENAQKAMQKLHDAFNDRYCEMEDGRFTYYDSIFRFPSNREMEDGGMTNSDYRQILAQKLNGIKRGDIPSDMALYAREHELVIVTGASDDLIEFDGAIRDEGGCYDGGDVYFDRTGAAQNGEKLANKITAVWCGNVDDEPAGDLSEFQTENGETITWTYKTDIPHATFMVYEDGKPYCRGIVFSIEDVK